MILGKSLLNSCEDKEFAKMSLIKIQPESANMCILLIYFLYFTGDSQSFAISSDLPIVPADENRGVH